jgi:hypothetical protein
LWIVHASARRHLNFLARAALAGKFAPILRKISRAMRAFDSRARNVMSTRRQNFPCAKIISRAELRGVHETFISHTAPAPRFGLRNLYRFNLI